MAIKFNWKDLQKRILNWVEAQKVMLNWIQIWPEWTPPPPPTPVYTRWVYWSQPLWLISISTNGSDWITITDKNVWASAVWNEWDTLTNANVGLCYQWWNDYWFTWNDNFPVIAWKLTAGNAYWPWNNWVNSQYYISDGNYPYNWNNAQNSNLWWWVTGDVSYIWNGGKQWFHVPTWNEWYFVRGILRQLWLITWQYTDYAPSTPVMAYLKMPLAWYLDNIGYSNNPTIWLKDDGVWWYYASSVEESDGKCWAFLFNESTIRWYSPSLLKCLGTSIRLFKNVVEIPDSSWTTEYYNSNTWGWIYWNQSLGLISISPDGLYWLTMEDKNLGATQVWNVWDTLSEANCGKYYQWWNTYGFPWIWNPGIGSITSYYGYINTTWYSWTNPYYSMIFAWPSSYIVNTDWQEPHNSNIWWWKVSITQGTKWISILPSGTHIPTLIEWKNLIAMCDGFWGRNWTDKCASEYLKLPPTWHHYSGSTDWYDVGTRWYYLFSSIDTNYYEYPLSTVSWFRTKPWRQQESWIATTTFEPCSWAFIRPFTDTPVVPDTSWTVLYTR